MKATGIVRPIDDLGRIVLPMELRKVMDIKKKDSLEIYVDSDKIILQKHQPSCIFCKSLDNIRDFKGKNVCANCAEELKKLSENN